LSSLTCEAATAPNRSSPPLFSPISTPAVLLSPPI
jgi:hypothetical protein